MEQEQTVYGINTGFGSLAQTKIARDKLAELQQNLILSHASGTGPLLDDGVVRLILVLKLNSLIRGFSGIRMKTVEYLLALLEADALPCIPAKGSVGASGDLAPLAHLSMVLLGEGEARIDGEYIAAWELLRKLGLEPLELQPKEGRTGPAQRDPGFHRPGIAWTVCRRGLPRILDRRRLPECRSQLEQL